MTVNKLTLPAKENAVQSKINEIIDNLGTSITVDQTYNGTSANPQSGVAIEGELSTNYQPKLVSGTNIKTINNTSLLGSGDISLAEDDTTISKNSDDELQTIGVIDDNVQNAYNFTVVGSPTITADGIASGFSASNYIKIANPLIGATKYSIKAKFTLPSTISGYGYIFADTSGATGLSIYYDSNNVMVRCASQTTVNSIGSSTANSVWKVEVIYDNGTAIVNYTKNGVSGTKTLNMTGYTDFQATNLFIGRRASGDTAYFKGSIDLKQFSITVDGVEVYKAWQPQALKYWTGTKTEYDAISSYDTTTLYNIEGVGLYKGTTLISNDGVSKSGDTMTGDLAISEDANAKIELTNTSFDSTSTTAPTSNLYAGAIDIFGLDNYHVGHFRTSHSSANYFQSQMGVRRSINNTDYEANITVAIKSDGTSICTFPNTTCVDGDWNTVAFNVISSATTINATTTKDFTLSTIPSDGYKYEIIYTIQGQTPATSGSGSRIGVGSSLTQVGSNIVAANIARSAATQYWAGSGNIIIGTDRKIYVKQIDNSSTTVSKFKVMAYRRIGTNA